MNIIIRLLITAGLVMFLAHFLPDVRVTGFTGAFIVAVVLALLNAIVKPILIILTIPITVVTFGLFLLVINTLMIVLADEFIDSFYVDGFWAALLFSILLSIAQSVVYSLIKEDKKKT